MNTTEEIPTRFMGKDPWPSRLHTIAHLSFDTSDGPWQALYFEKETHVFRPVLIWCGVTDAKGKYIDGDKRSHGAFGLVAVGNRLEICDTHETFVAYVQNPDARMIRDLIYDWRMANNR